MKKQLTMMVSACMLAASMTSAMAEDMFDTYGKVFVPGSENMTELDIHNNELFDIVAAIKEIESSDGEILFEELDWEIVKDENGQPIMNEETQLFYTNIYHKITYTNGDFVKKLVYTKSDSNSLSLPGAGYPVFTDEAIEDEYVLTCNVEGGRDIYLIKSADGEIVEQTLIFEERGVDPENYDNGYNVYEIIVDENGNETRELYFEGKSYEDFYEQVIEAYSDDFAYNDGVKYDEENFDLVDIDKNIVASSGELSYYGYVYNLGYLVETYNNGGTLPFDADDPEIYRMFGSVVTDIISKDTYYFYNANISSFNDSGYAIVSTNDRGTVKEYVAKLKKPAIVTVFLDGKKIKFDQIPVIDEGRTLVPLRAIFEAIGAEVEWDGETKTITAADGENDIKLVIDKSEATVNGETVTLDVPAKLVNGRTMVPARFIADSFGVTTDWDGEMKQVILTTK